MNEQVATPARLIEGAILDSDYPAAAIAASAAGRTGVEYVITPTGRVMTCGVTASSGNQDLDLATCDLIRSRFVFKPARDEQGRAVQEHRRQTVAWQLPPGVVPFTPNPYNYNVVATVGPDGRVKSCDVTGVLNSEIDRARLCPSQVFKPPTDASGRPTSRRVSFHGSMTVEDVPN